MILGAWRRSWLAYEFDRDSARYTRRLARLGELLPICGFGAIEKTREHGRTFFGLYRWGGRIWFQAGTRTWRLDTPDLRLVYRLVDNGRASEFSLHEGDRTAFMCSYRHPIRALFARGQPDPDNVDSEGHHFLAHVAGQRLPLDDSEIWHDGEATISRQTSDNVRVAIREHLALLADPERQREYEKRAQIADVPAELFCAWFDDSYRPEDSLFQQAFAPDEREALRKFTAQLERAMSEMGEVSEIKGVDDLQTRPTWTQVVEQAALALSRLPETRSGRS
jgi:hypothetical protein